MTSQAILVLAVVFMAGVLALELHVLTPLLWRGIHPAELGPLMAGW